MLSALALAGALALDVVAGEPPRSTHPVAWLGRAAGAVDRTRHHPRVVGVAAALALPALFALALGAAVLAAGRFHPLAGALAGALALFVSTSLRRLLDRVREVVALSERDLATARRRLKTLAGRDAAALSPEAVRSAALESLAENAADGLVAPLSGFAVANAVARALGAGPVGALAAGCGGAAWVKAVNTLDSMLGYPAKPAGWAPARLDDAVMWVPARATALLLAAATGTPGALAPARRLARSPPSPNSGWPMGTLAAALAVRLEKPGVYVLNADADPPDPERAALAVRRVALAGVLAYLLAGVVTWS